ncbi:MAG: GtrA family protein [Minisyncoccia bacterium]|jgi:putative flippase GtrA
MQKKDFRLILVVGVAVGLLIQPIILNVLPQVHLGILGRILIFVFFAVFAPFALWIADLVSRWWKGLYQFAQFAAVGTLNSFIDVGVFNLETFILGTAAVSTTMFAVLKAISFLCATTNSFFWNKYWTFSSSSTTDGSAHQTKETISFYVVAFIGWAVNVGVATLVKTLEPSGIAARVWVNIVAPVFGIAASFLWDFFGYKYLVFKKS